MAIIFAVIIYPIILFDKIKMRKNPLRTPKLKEY